MENTIKNYKYAGTWWNSRDIELIEKERIVYALYGWNGEAYTESWACTGEHNMDSSKESYTITPVYKEDEIGDFDLVDFEIELLG